MPPYDHEEDDAQQDSRLGCQLCEIRMRMPGHVLCTYCDYLGVRNYAAVGIRALEYQLYKYADWSVYQATHPTEGEANA